MALAVFVLLQLLGKGRGAGSTEPSAHSQPWGTRAPVTLNLARPWNAKVTWKMGEMIENTGQPL